MKKKNGKKNMMSTQLAVINWINIKNRRVEYFYEMINLKLKKMRNRKHGTMGELT